MDDRTRTAMTVTGSYHSGGWCAPQAEPARVCVSEPLTLVASYEAERAAFAVFESRMAWADRARKRGDRFKADLAAGRAWVELAAALGVVWAGGAA